MSKIINQNENIFPQRIQSIDGLASFIDEVRKSRDEEFKKVRIPLKKRTVIVLDSNQDTAREYIKLFGKGKSYSNSNTFNEEVTKGTVLFGLKDNKPLVLLVSTRLPIDRSGSYSGLQYESYEGLTVANRIRGGFANFPKDIPIVLYSSQTTRAQKKDVKKIEGIVAYMQKPLTTEEIESELFASEEKAFRSKYKKLFKAACDFRYTHLTLKKPEENK